jgi:Protein of unknown function (DUF2971)
MESNDPVHPIFRNVPPPEAKLWRYLSFAKFASLLHSPRLHFTRVDHFDDHFEGAWPRSDLEFWTSDTIVRVFHVPSLTEQMRSNVAASCWIELPHESAAMWRLYAPGDEGVAVATTFGKLHNLIKDAGKPDEWLAGAARVTYLDHFNTGLIRNLETGERWPNTMTPFMLKNAGKPDEWLAGAARVTYLDHFNTGLIRNLETGERWPNTMTPFMLKNISYENEKEVRALIMALSQTPDGMAFNQIPEDGFDLQLNLKDFVDEIVVNPFCRTWFTDTITELCRCYGLEIKVGKSSLSPDVFYMHRQEGGHAAR